LKPRFNLLDEPWLPVCLADGRVCEVGLLELFERAGEIRMLAESEPPSLVAEYRLLLAITHRALSQARGGWADRDRADWYREGLPREALRDYLEYWRERFWLFHPERPFMQVAALATLEETRERRKPWTQVALGRVTGNVPVVFDHCCDATPSPVPPSLVLRALLGFLQFTPGGLVKILRDSDRAGPLANTAAVLPLGATLQQTLCLALHPASTQDDPPSWERDPLQPGDLLAEPSPARGINDRYTRLSRAVLLEETDDGQVQWLRFAPGLALAEDSSGAEPMASFRAGSGGPLRLTVSEGRAVWRDLPALLAGAGGPAGRPAAILAWASGLHPCLGASRHEQPLLVAGLASDQAKLLRWRCEQIVLPAGLLADSSQAGRVRCEIERAEALYAQIHRRAVAMLADAMPDPHSRDSRARARAVLDRGASAAIFFATAERALPALLGDGDEARRCWSAGLRLAAEACWGVLRSTLGGSPLALRAEARAWPDFSALLRDLQLPEPREGGA